MLDECLEFFRIFQEKFLPLGVFLLDILLFPEAKGFLVLGVFESSTLFIQKLISVNQ